MMSEIQKYLHIDAPIEQVWAALTDPAVVKGWMGDETVNIDLKVGGIYKLFGGETLGRFTLIEQPVCLEYTWRQSAWKEAWANSLVRWELMPDGQGTQIQLVHSYFPNEDERNSHDEGWDTDWLAPMKDWLESNSRAR